MGLESESGRFDLPWFREENVPSPHRTSELHRTGEGPGARVTRQEGKDSKVGVGTGIKKSPRKELEGTVPFRGIYVRRGPPVVFSH